MPGPSRGQKRRVVSAPAWAEKRRRVTLPDEDQALQDTATGIVLFNPAFCCANAVITAEISTGQAPSEYRPYRSDSSYRVKGVPLSYSWKSAIDLLCSTFMCTAETKPLLK